MQYIALKELNLGNGRTAKPGDEVPEAAGWSRAWFSTGHVAMCPDDMAEELRRTLHAGHVHLLNNHPLGQHHMHVAAAEAAQSSARGGEVDAAPLGGDGVVATDLAPPQVAAARDTSVPLEKADQNTSLGDTLTDGQREVIHNLMAPPELKDAPPLDNGPTPPGKEPITADGGRPLGDPASDAVDALDEAAGEPEAEATPEPESTPSSDDSARARRRRPRRKG